MRALTQVRPGPKRAADESELDLSMLPTKRDWRRFQAFCRHFLTIPETGEPFILKAFQVEIVKGLFPSKGTRPKMGLCSLARGQGKSLLASAICVYGLFGDGVVQPQVLAVASSLEQAKRIVFRSAVVMIRNSPELDRRAKITQEEIETPWNGGQMFPLPATEAGLQGWRHSLAVIDELHVVDQVVWESVMSGGGKRADSLTLAISTPPMNPDSVMKTLAVEAKANADPSFFYVEYSSDNSHSADCRHCWRLASPAMLGRGAFVHEDRLVALRKKMREGSFRRLLLAQWDVETEDQWLTPEAWKACEDRRDIENDSPVVLAFDGSYSGDATAIIAISVEAVPHIMPVAIWEPGGRLDYRVPIADVEQALRDACRRWRVVEVACDPFRWQKSLQSLQAEGLPMAEFGQSTARMTPATQSLYEAVMNQQVTHNGDADLARHVLNSRCTDDHRGIRLHKADKHSPQKIDAAVCAVMGHSRAVFYASQPVKKKGRAVSWSYS